MISPLQKYLNSSVNWPFSRLGVVTFEIYSWIHIIITKTFVHPHWSHKKMLRARTQMNMIISVWNPCFCDTNKLENLLLQSSCDNYGLMYLCYIQYQFKHRQSPGWLSILLMAWHLIWWFASTEKEYCPSWHQMTLLRPSVLKQHKTFNSLKLRTNCTGSKVNFGGYLPFGKEDINLGWDILVALHDNCT